MWWHKTQSEEQIVDANAERARETAIQVSADDRAFWFVLAENWESLPKRRKRPRLGERELNVFPLKVYFCSDSPCAALAGNLRTWP